LFIESVGAIEITPARHHVGHFHCGSPELAGTFSNPPPEMHEALNRSAALPGDIMRRISGCD
jgi:hypothetical protein